MNEGKKDKKVRERRKKGKKIREIRKKKRKKGIGEKCK